MTATEIKKQFDNINLFLNKLSISLTEDIQYDGIDKVYLMNKYIQEVKNVVIHIQSQLEHKM